MCETTKEDKIRNKFIIVDKIIVIGIDRILSIDHVIWKDDLKAVWVAMAINVEEKRRREIPKKRWINKIKNDTKITNKSKKVLRTRTDYFENVE